jgi:putative hydrolase of the HAD superfamily
MKAIIFDLDDTLFPEIEYVRSGFSCVASYLSFEYKLDKDVLYERMVHILNSEGRGKIFNILLEGVGLYSDDLLHLLIYLYRSHRPRDLTLFKESLPVIQALKESGYSLGIITDGMASIQRMKIDALHLQPFFDVILCSDELGREHWKPSDTCFKIMLNLLGINPAEAVYVGDNVVKDFYAPNRIGMLTIQVKRNAAEKIIPGLSKTYLARHVVADLYGIIPLIKDNSFDKR